jgi:hypothetical protein
MTQDSTMSRWYSKNENGARKAQLENEPQTENGRPEWTRTIDLFRVKVQLINTSNHFHVRGGTAKPL